MSALAETWKLIDRCRDGGYDLWTIEEKRRMHDIVVAFKKTGLIHSHDMLWLRQCDENFAGLVAVKRTFRRRRAR